MKQKPLAKFYLKRQGLNSYIYEIKYSHSTKADYFTYFPDFKTAKIALIRVVREAFKPCKEKLTNVLNLTEKDLEIQK